MITIANGIEKYIGATPALTANQLTRLRFLQRQPIGKRDAEKYEPQDIIAHCEARIAEVKAFTIAADICALRAVFDYADIGLGLPGVSSASIHRAMPILKRRKLVAGSNRRQRTPTLAEHTAILAHLRRRDAASLTAEAVAYQYESGHRIGETARIWWGDLRDKTILVRDMKHPTKKAGNHRRLVVLDKAHEILIRQPRLTADPQERIFKICAKSVSAAFHRACVDLGIEGLHLHDYRAGVVTRLVIADYTPGQIMAVTGHESAEMPMSVYNRLKAEDFPRRPI